MGKRFLLSAIAVSVIAGSAYAGDLNLTINEKNDVNYTKEWTLQNSLKSKASEITIAPAFVYTPKNIPLGSEKNPVLNVKFTNVKDIKVDRGNKKLMVCEIDTSDKPVQEDPVLKYKADNGVDGFTFVSYSSNGEDVYMTNGKRYAVYVGAELNCKKDTSHLLTLKNDANTTLTLKDKDVKSVGIEVSLGTGDSQDVHDTATGTVGKMIDQICCEVNTLLDAKINSGSDFMAFGVVGNNACGNNSTPKTDDLTIQCKQYSTNYGIRDFNDIMNIKADQSLPFDADNIAANKNKNKNKTAVAADDIKVGTNEVNVTYKDDTADINAASTTKYTVTLAVTGDKKIPVTNFTVDFGLDLNKNGSVDMYKLQDASAGSWTYNGTTVTTPYVVANGNTQTAIRLVNNSNVDANVYWTCTDDNGVTVSLLEVKSADQKSVQLKAGGASAWLAKDVLAAAQAQNPDFAPNGKMKCSALITTPNQNQATGVTIMTINGARDRVIPTN